MTPKEKAKDLFNKYYLFIDIKNYENTKACALIAVDELIAELAYIRNYDEEIDEKMIIKIDQRQDYLIEVERILKSL
jgi:hypothetical protein